MVQEKHAIPIWFFIGSLLAIYGILILGAGVYGVFVPSADTVVLARLHVALWWGGGMLLLGLIYVVRFWPA